MVNTLKVEKREQATQSELKGLRAEGKIPAVVYGKSINNASIAVEEKELLALLKSNPNAIVQMDLPEQGKYPVMIGDMQRDALKRNILHIDFHQINVKDPIKVSIRIDVTGKAKGVEEGGILQQQMNELELQCLPHLIPTQITVDVSELNVGESLQVSDIKVAKEITILSAPSDTVVSVLVPQKVYDDEEETEEQHVEVKDADSVEVIDKEDN